MESADPKSKLILIVDDDDSVQKLFIHVLGREGFRLDSAMDGEEALRKVDQISPSLVLLDLMLPRYGGFEVLRQLQAGEHAKMPIIVITGRYTDHSTAELIRQESNVVEFIEKPVKMQILLECLHRTLKTRSPHPPEPKSI